MKWIKKGLIYCANQTSEWAYSHAAVPTPYHFSDTVLRIFCAFRDRENISRIGYVDVEADNPKNIVNISVNPVLDIGMLGAFDDNGVLPASIVKYEGKLYLYYGGFQLGVKIPYYIFCGLAISTDNGNSFKRYQTVPITDRSNAESFFRVANYVIKDHEQWKMWYIAGSSWINLHGKMLPEYSIKYLESPDGVTWGKEGKLCISPQNDEHGFGRPYIVKSEQGYKMYYSVRSLSKGYQLGYAESTDGIYWKRRDEEIGISVSPEGWDSLSQCYCAFIKHKKKTYLFYSGNNYGETGFGYAELDMESS